MARSTRMAWQSAAAVAAALIVAVAAGGSDGSLAQNLPKDQRAQKKAAPKGPVQPLRKGPLAVGPNRVIGAPHRPPLGPAALPPGARIAPHVAPAAKGPAGGFANTNPRINALSKAGAPNARFGNQFGARNVNQPRGFTRRDPLLRAVNARTPQLRQVQRFTHRSEMLALRARLPTYPLPGERNFTGIPPVSETRFVSAEMVCQWGPDMTQAGIEAVARQHNLAILSVQRSVLTGGTLVHFRIGGNRAARDVVRAMEAERIISQPNYVYEAVQAAEPAAAETASGGSEQYAANKLRLAEVHKIATGKGVTIAVIDSEIDNAHPELKQAIAERFDAVGKPDRPHTHGTGMAGAIVAQDRLIGVAPGARTLAVHAFATGTQQSPQATTQAIIAGLEWALGKGARVINMSFAGPYDPMLALALKRAAEKGAVLIAAVGNAGPKSPPLYPGADPRVIGVTAVDEADQLYKGANIGAQVAIAAPGVDVMVPAPEDAYQLTTGTSVSAAHVSGVAALLLEKHPEADAQTILEVLTSSATRLGNKRDDRLGWGLVDPLAALAELDTRVTDMKVAAPAGAPTPVQAAAPAPSAAATPASASAKPALPRPGLYAPKQ